MRLLHRCLVLFCLFFSAALSAAEKPIIILDPGHGGKDEGARVRTVVEKQLTLRTAYLTKKELELLGYRVVLTRARDTFLPLQTRANIANRRPESLFISIHYNSAVSPQASGIEVFYYQSKHPARAIPSRQLATSILSQMVTETGGRSRGVKRGNFHVIRQTDMPAVLIEAGFITNFEERNLIKTQTYLEKIAKGIALGVHKHIIK